MNLITMCVHDENDVLTRKMLGPLNIIESKQRQSFKNISKLQKKMGF